MQLSEQQLIKNAYNQAASAYRKKYAEMLPRTDEVDRAFAFMTESESRVLEIGCAYGREARYILTKTSQYTGIDICQQYINQAKQELPEGNFVCVDVLEYDFPSRLDIVFAFASLLHLDKTSLRTVLEKVCQQLSHGGVIFLSLKKRDNYDSEVITDAHSTRKFYYYNQQTILDLSKDLFDEVLYQEQTLKEPWFTVILRKKG